MASPSVPNVVDARFIAEARDVPGLPPAGPPEIAVAGRSNVGKSTLLNRLAARRSLARVSKTPGRTRGLVFFELTLAPHDGQAARSLRLVDLPGYGYAKISRDERKTWQHLVEGYVQARRETIALFLVLVDARRGPEEEERQLCEWLDTKGVPWQLVVTKADKLGAAERGALRAREPRTMLVSSETGAGFDELWRAMTPNG